MVATATQIQEVGPRYACGIDSPTFGWQGLFIRQETYSRQQQLLKRQEVIAALTQAIADRDIDFWTRVSQFDWTKGQNQKLFTDGSRYDDAAGIDVHTLGRIALVPMPTVLQGPAGPLRGRGGTQNANGIPSGNPGMYFPWTDGNYIYSVDNGATWLTGTGPVGGRIGDIHTGGNNVFFAFYNAGGVWWLPPGALVQYDTGGNRYIKLLYDNLAKKLYGITAPDQNVQLHKINPGAGPTIVYDWLAGRIEGLALYQGNVVTSYNFGSPPHGTSQSRLYQYNGTTVSTLADMPDGSWVTGLYAYLGYLFITTIEADPFNPGQDIGALYYMLGTTGPTRVDTIDATYTDDIVTTCFLGYPHFLIGQGTSLYVATKQRLTRYDLINGGVSRSFGDNQISTLTGYIEGVASVRGRLYALVGTVGGAGNGGVVSLNPVAAGGLISTLGNAGQQLVGSRMDLGLPYVDKYWYAFEVVCDALIAGQQIAMEYSLDDGVTWAACGGSPLATIGTTRFNFLIQKANPHTKYRTTLIAAAGIASPVIHAIAARFAPSNPQKKVWNFTVSAYDLIRGRGNKIEDGYGKDVIAFLANVAQQSETVTFYELNDSTRTPHTVWVLQAETDTSGSGATYGPTRNEGDIPIILWEV